MNAQYHEVRILGRLCYLSDEDLRVFYGLAGNVTGQRKSFAELPEDAFIVRAVWQRKRDQARQKQLARGESFAARNRAQKRDQARQKQLAGVQK